MAGFGVRMRFWTCFVSGYAGEAESGVELAEQVC